MHPNPVVMQPDRNFEHSSFVFEVAGASVHSRTLQELDPFILFTVHGPSDPIRPAHPYD